MEKTLDQKIYELQIEVDQLRLSQLQKEKAELLKSGDAGSEPVRRRMSRKDFNKLDPTAARDFLLKEKGELFD